MSALVEKQQIFCRNLGILLVWASSRGYALTVGEAMRDPRIAQLNAQEGKGIANSLHSRRLAMDLNLFRAGVYQASSESYAELGAFWKSLDPLNRWGGDFKPVPDGNHFSMEDGGVK